MWKFLKNIAGRVFGSPAPHTVEKCYQLLITIQPHQHRDILLRHDYGFLGFRSNDLYVSGRILVATFCLQQQHLDGVKQKQTQINLPLKLQYSMISVRCYWRALHDDEAV